MHKIAQAHKASAIYGLKKFTSAYLFQIAREKSCDYILIIYMKNSRQLTSAEATHTCHTIMEKLRHPAGLAFDELSYAKSSLLLHHFNFLHSVLD